MCSQDRKTQLLIMLNDNPNNNAVLEAGLVITKRGCKATLKLGNLLWHAHDDIGSISVPLRAGADLELIKRELETLGYVTHSTSRKNFNT